MHFGQNKRAFSALYYQINFFHFRPYNHDKFIDSNWITRELNQLETLSDTMATAKPWEYSNITQSGSKTYYMLLTVVY